MYETMPNKLNVTTSFTVTDASARIVRSEELPAGTDLPDRLRLAHRNYQLQGWTVDPLLPGRWSFVAEKSGQRLLIGIRRPLPATAEAPTTIADRLNQQVPRTGDSGRLG